MSVNFDLKINVTTLIATAVLIIGAFLYLNHSKNKTIGRWVDNYEIAQAASEENGGLFRRASDSLVVTGRTINVLNSEIKALAKSDSIQRGLVKHYKELAAVTKVETEFITDTVEVPVPVYIANDTTVSFSNPCYGLNLSLSDGLISINDISIHNRQDIVVGERKTGLWRTEQSFDIRNSNPCIVTTGVTTYNIVVEKKWHQKWYIHAIYAVSQ
jgi:hypothetical protein